MCELSLFFSCFFVHSFRKGKFPLQTLLFNRNKKLFLKNKKILNNSSFEENRKNIFYISKKLFFHMRRRLLARSRALLVTAACSDVVERVKSVYVQLSFTSPAGHPLHLAASHSSFFFGEKRKTQEKAE